MRHLRRILIYIFILCMTLALVACNRNKKVDIQGDVPVVVEDMSQATKEKILSEISEYQKKYDDYYGWIYVSGTDVSVPIAQTNDNKYYLRRSFDKTYNMDGTTFVDHSNTRNPDEESNLVIYGHNLENKKQFSTLLNLKNINVSNQAKIYLFYKDNIYVYQPFAVYITNINFNYIQTRFRGQEFNNLMSQIMTKNEVKLNISPTNEDKIITLSTCTNDNKSERFVVSGILKEKQ